MLILLSGVSLIGIAELASAQDTIRVTRADCARLVAYQADPGVDFQPGVDVRGNPVASADLDRRALALPETIAVVIDIDLQERFGVPANSVLYDPEAFIGVADIRLADGAVRFNGEPLTDPEEAALAAACANAGSQPPN